MAVADSECRPTRAYALRAVDRSIFPRIPNGNLNGPSIMVGEKGADHSLGKQPLPKDNRAPWINPRWETSDSETMGMAGAPGLRASRGRLAPELHSE